jgi:parallel beta-helix repeat protein
MVDSTASDTASVTVSTSANGNDYYVAPNGSDSNDGAACRPWATIQHADGVVQPGDTVHVAPGTYGPYSSAITTYSNGTPSAHIRFVSDVRWGAQISGTAADVWAVGGSYEDIEGFDLSSGANTNQIIQSSGFNDRFIGNRIHDMRNTTCMSGAGIHLGTGSSYNSVIGNLIYNIGLAPSAGCNQTHGIYVSTSNNTLENNIILHCGDLGIHLWGNSPSFNKITNNTVMGNWNGVLIGSANSTPASGNFVANNIMYKNLSRGMYETGTTGTNTITDNVNYGNGSPWGLASDSPQNTITSDPQFVNDTGTATGNYHVGSGSPVRGAGTSTDAPGQDFDGGSRASQPDIGAYEYGTTPSVWPWM